MMVHSVKWDTLIGDAMIQIYSFLLAGKSQFLHRLWRNSSSHRSVCSSLALIVEISTENLRLSGWKRLCSCQLWKWQSILSCSKGQVYNLCLTLFFWLPHSNEIKFLECLCPDNLLQSYSILRLPSMEMETSTIHT